MVANESEGAVRKVMLIIEYMSEQRRRLTIQEISEELEISATTVHRILSNLKSLGYVSQYSNKSYYLTYKLFEVAGKLMEQDNLISTITPYMNYFSRKYSCDVGLSAFNDKNLINLITIGNGKNPRMTLFSPGSAQPAYCTAAGKVFLANMSKDAQLSWFASNTLVPYTEKTIIDKDQLIKQLEDIKKCGFGYACCEFMEGVACVGIPLYDRDCNIRGTINITVNEDRFDEIIKQEFIDEVKFTLKGKLTNFFAEPPSDKSRILSDF